MKQVGSELARKCADENVKKIKDELDGIRCEEGGIHSGKLWKLRKKLFPRSRDPPTAMLDFEGNLTTNELRIKEVALETYKKRLQNRPIKDDLASMKADKEELAYKRMELAKDKKTPPWTNKEL